MVHSVIEPSYMRTLYPRYFKVKYDSDACMPELQYVTTLRFGVTPAAS